VVSLPNQRATDMSWTPILAKEKEKNPNGFPGGRRRESGGGQSEPLSRFLLPIPYPPALGGRGAESSQSAERTVFEELIIIKN